MKNPKIGELIRGKRKADRRYTHTNSRMNLAKVVNIDNPKTIWIEILDHTDSSLKGEIFMVHPKFFKRVESQNLI